VIRIMPGKLESPFSKNFKHVQKREAILSEAAKAFNLQGIRVTTLFDIAERLKLTKTTLYYYVKSKEELIYQCYLSSCYKLGELFEEAESSQGSGQEKLAVFIRAYFRTWKAIATGQQPHYAMLTEIRALKKAHRREVAALYSVLFKRMKSIIQSGMSDGSIVARHSLDTALAMFGLVQMTVLWLPKITLEEFDQAAESFSDLVFRGIATGDEFLTGSLPCIPVMPISFEQQAQSFRKQEAFYKTGSAFFNRKGFKGTSLDEIADALDVTKGTFYYHIKDKEELLFHCFQRSLSIIKNMQDLAENNARNGLEELQFCTYYLFHIQNGDAGPLIRFNLIPSLSKSQKREVVGEINALSRRFGNMIRKGMADGSIRQLDPFIAEQVLNTAINISVELQWMRPIEDIGEAYQSYFKFYFTGIAESRNGKSRESS